MNNPEVLPSEGGSLPCVTIQGKAWVFRAFVSRAGPWSLNKSVVREGVVAPSVSMSSGAWSSPTGVPRRKISVGTYYTQGLGGVQRGFVCRYALPPSLPHSLSPSKFGGSISPPHQTRPPCWLSAVDMRHYLVKL